MSATPPELVLRSHRILTVNLQAGVTSNLGDYVRRSQRIPVPYYILSYTVLPSFNMSSSVGWVELYLSEVPNEDVNSIVSRRNLLSEASNLTRIYAHSYYVVKEIDVNLYVRRESYIYMKARQTSTLNGAWSTVKILIPSQQTEAL